MKNNPIRHLIVALLALALVLCPAALAESYTAGAMRLLHYEGTVEILDAAGAPRFIMENARFDSGETLVTGEDGVAAVGLDADRIVSLDSNSRVIFEKHSNAMKLTLAEGALLLDVQKKLDPNERLDIQTSTMTVGIRGTIVYLTERPGDTGDGVRNTLGVLEGTAELTYLNPNGVRQTVPVSAGEVATLTGVSAAEPVTDVLVKPLTPQDVPGFVTNLPDALPATIQRVEEGLEGLSGVETAYDFPADGVWTWDAPVTLVAQSASKLYDGQPLTRPSDVLVYGLPAQLTIHVTARGEITYPGLNTNSVGDYAIYNAAGMDVTSHFTNIQKVDGSLVVDPAPLTVWTGSAEKVYDGTPLTNPEAGISAQPGYEKNTTPWRNLSYVQTTATNAQVLLGMCGVTWVHGTNPLTEETKEIALQAGERLTVVLNDEGEGQSIEFKIEKLSVEEIPEEALRVYANNPEVLKQACQDAGWDPEALAERIAQLAEQDDALVSRHGLDVSDEEAGRLMVDCTNVRITVDTKITNYNDRALGSEEAHFTPVHVPEGIVVTATGRQTEVGQSPNTYEVDWGDSDPSWYIFSEELGTLTVTAPEEDPEVDDAVTLTADSASKVYDGTPLTADGFTATGLPEGYTATAVTEGSQTDAGTGENSIASYNILDADGEDVTEQFTNVVTESGTLEVTPAGVTVSTGSETKPYDGRPLTCDEATITGLVGGETATVTATGTITDVGSAENGYAIDWGETDKGNYTVTESLGTLEVTANDGEVTFGFSADAVSKAYDGTPLSIDIAMEPASNAADDPGADAAQPDITITAQGLPKGLGFTARASASQLNVGSCTFAITDLAILDGDGNEVTDFFTNVNTLDGTLTVEPAEVTVTTGSESKVFDGKPLTGGGATITGLVKGESATVTATGTITDVGSAVNTYAIDWGETRKENYTISESLGTLEVTPLAVSFDLGGYTAEYCGDVLLPDGPSSEDATGTDTRVLTDDTERDIGVAATFSLPGGEVVLTVYGFEDAGSHTLNAQAEFLSGKAENYTFSYTNTAMTIVPMEVTVRLHDGADLAYNGDTQLGHFSASWSGFDIGYELDGEHAITWGSDRIVVNVTGGGADAGDYTLACTFAPDGDVNMGNYHFNVTGTAMTIVPAPLTIATGTATKPYDGTPLTNGGATLTGLVDGETATVEANGSQTDIGESYNHYKITWGTAKASNYALTEYLGTLTVTRCVVTVTSPSVEKVYDGEPLTPSTLDVSGLPEGYYCHIAGGTLLGSQTDVGESDITIDLNGIGITKEDSIPVDKGNFDIVTNLGKLKVTPATLTVKTGSADKLYDGLTLTNSEASLTGLVNGETATVVATGSQTEPGESKNTYKITWGTAKADNYTISEDLGTLVVVASTAGLSLSLPPAKTFGKPKATDEPTPAPTAAPTEAPEPEPTEAPTETPEPEPTPAPTEAPEPTEVPTEAPEPEPTEAPSEAPTSNTPKASEGDPTAEAEPAAIDAPANKPTDAPKAEPAEEVQEEPAREAEDKSSKEAEEKPSKEAEDQPVKEAEDKPVKEVAEEPAETPADDPGETPSDDAD